MEAGSILCTPRCSIWQHTHTVSVNYIYSCTCKHVDSICELYSCTCKHVDRHILYMCRYKAQSGDPYDLCSRTQWWKLPRVQHMYTFIHALSWQAYTSKYVTAADLNLAGRTCVRLTVGVQAVRILKAAREL